MQPLSCPTPYLLQSCLLLCIAVPLPRMIATQEQSPDLPCSRYFPHTHQEAIANYERLYKIYEKYHRPPAFTRQFIMTKAYLECCKSMRVYVSCSHVPLTQAQRKLLTRSFSERDPVNLAANIGRYAKYFSPKKLKKHFGYRKNFYWVYYQKTKQLLPNIAVYLQGCPFGGYKNKSTSTYQEKDYRFFDVIHVSGYAFDHTKQPDYEYFFGGQQGAITAEKKNELLQRTKEIFDKIFKCALDHNKEKIILSLFGCASFSSLYQDQDKKSFLEAIWLNALQESLATWKDALNKGKVTEIALIGKTSQVKLKEQAVQECIKNQGFTFKKYGGLREMLFSEKLGDLKKVLGVNAWDPASKPGNENVNWSLDGAFGYYGALQAGDPFLNPFYNEKDMIVPVINKKALKIPDDYLLSGDDGKEGEIADQNNGESGAHSSNGWTVYLPLMALAGLSITIVTLCSNKKVRKARKSKRALYGANTVGKRFFLSAIKP